MNLYIMAPRQLIKIARKLDTMFNDNIKVVSTWYLRWDGIDKTLDPNDVSLELFQNEREMNISDAALMLTKDEHGLELWCELGRFIQRKVIVYWVDLGSNSRLPLSIHSALVVKFRSEQLAVEYINNSNKR